MVTFGDMAQSLYNLRKKYGLYYNPIDQEILMECNNLKK